MLNRIIDEVKKCIENECFIAALALALTIPDICGKAEYPDMRKSKRYINWYTSYIGKYEKPVDKYGADVPYSSGELIYKLRCSMLHQGSPGISPDDVKDFEEEQCKVDEFVLTISSKYDTGFSRVTYDKDFAVKERMLEVNIICLCNRICAASMKYYLENKEKFNFFNYQLNDIRHAYDGLFTVVDTDDQ